MNKTLIPWVKNPDGTPGYTWNPITGCLNQVDGMCQGGNFPCYADRLANTRLFERYTTNNNYAPPFSDGKGISSDLSDTFDPFYPRFWEDRLGELRQRNKNLIEKGLDSPRGIFVCDMGELFGDWLPLEWQEAILEEIDNKHDRFYLLTKQPQNLPQWSPFPDNCFVGVSATNWLQFSEALGHLATVEAKVKYLSFEPLLERIQFDMMQKMLFPKVVQWVIIGACTGTKKDMEKMVKQHPGLTLMPFGKKWSAQPELSWVQTIALAATKANIPLFLKDNLKPLLPNRMPFYGTYIWKEMSNGAMITMSENRYRQELPE
uniref:DUF5131 family protein n=1 Tax=viral metagenome TaxID=1070528 RepID=A0A6M3MDY7_9ZZZZ